MLLLQKPLVAELMNDIRGLVDDPPESESVLGRVRESASRCDQLRKVAVLTQQIIAEQGYVQIRGLPVLNASRHFLAIATLLGKVFIDPAVGSAIIPAHVKPGEALMGNQLRELPLHTDYSMMDNPPRLTMSCCVRPDSVAGFGAVFVSDVESLCFAVESEPRIERFRIVRFPFASRNAQDDVDVIDKPILSNGSSGDGILVRYHRSRIRQGFRHRGQTPTPEQASTLLEFEDLARKGMQTLDPGVGDITVIDNHRMLHGRGRCSVEVDADGGTVGRQMMFVFAY